MISTNKLKVINVLDTVLGTGTSLKDNEQAHHCPFCHHHKKKLQVNVITQYWHCWVCNAKGRSLNRLLRKLNATESELHTIYKIYGEDQYTQYTAEEESTIELQLPTEFKKLYPHPTYINPIHNQVLSYLKKRNIDELLIQKYNIGFCESGIYGGRIIIPSYDSLGKLNYFEARTIYPDEWLKYKKPPINRNVIMFESQINWKEPITLVEGVFDSFSIRRNVIPILGKFIPKKLMDKIFLEGVREINIMLDSDAVRESTELSKYFINNGIRVKNIIPKNKDFGESTFNETIIKLKQSTYTQWDNIVIDKLNSI
jgi:ribosomal protein L37AE/L43A